ncbi:MAG: AsmA-like C-terminal region-containing protein [Pseudomonadota bacterium]
MVRQTAKVIFFEVLGGLALLVMAVIAIFAIRLASGPVELAFLELRVERALAQTRNGDPVIIDRLTLQWDPSSRRVEVVATGVALLDKTNTRKGLGEEARIDLDAGALLTGKVEILSAELRGGWLAVENKAPNIWSIGGTNLPEFTGSALPQTPFEWLADLNKRSQNLSQTIQTIGEGASLEALSFQGMEMRFTDLSGGSLGTIVDAASVLQRRGQDWSLSLSGNGEGVGLPGRFSIDLSTEDDAKRFEGSLTVDSWKLSDIFDAVGLTDLEQTGMILLTTSLNFTSTNDNGLEEIRVRLTSQENGAIALFDDRFRVSSIDTDLLYQPAEDRLIINNLTMDSNLFRGRVQGSVTNLIAPNMLHELALSSDIFTVDLTPYFPEAWTFERGQLDATVSDDFRVFAIRGASTQYDTLRFSAQGELDFGVQSQGNELPFALDVTAEAIGETGKDTVLTFWPETLGDGGRRFVRDRLETGILTGVTAAISLKPDSREQGYLRDEGLDVRFGFRDGRVRFLVDMPPVDNAVGTGRLTGNSFRADVNNATYDDWEISSGRFDFPQLNPRGQDFIVTAEGTGPAVSILRQLSNSRVRLQETTGFDPERVSGLADASLTFRRRSTGQVPLEDTELQVNAVIQEAGLKDIVFGQSLENGRVDVDMTQDRLLLSGFADLGPVPVQFSWRDALVNDNRPADLSASGIINPSALNELGLFGRAYLTGDIPVDVQGEVGGNGLGEAQFAFDLRGARISVDEIGWVKPAGDAARAVIKFDGQGGANSSTLRLESETAIIDGDIQLQSDGRLQTLSLRQFFVDGLADVAGELTRRSGGGADIQVTGPFFNLEPLLSGVGTLGSTEAAAFGVALNVDTNVERLRLRKGLDLLNATAALEATEDRLLSLEARGQTTSGDDLSFEYDHTGSDQPELRLETENAGFLAQAFFGFDFIEGGDLQLTGQLGSDELPSTFLAEVRNARLVNAPFVTQILSLASLRGLSDTLSGDGVLFSNITVPISVGGGRYIVEGGRASGPALGLTMNGWVATEGDGIELDGVLVPSFGVNSALGGVPIIGDLFVGRKGEGIFSITYSVRGSLERAQVAVNPLSAVTPGILRRIFENPSDTSIPEAIPTDPNLKPPSELPELPEDEVITPTPGGDLQP